MIDVMQVVACVYAGGFIGGAILGAVNDGHRGLSPAQCFGILAVWPLLGLLFIVHCIFAEKF